MNLINESNPKEKEIRINHLNKIKDLILEKLTEWEKEDLYNWLDSKIEHDPKVELDYNEDEIVNYVLADTNLLEEILHETDHQYFIDMCLSKNNILEFLETLSANYFDEMNEFFCNKYLNNPE